MAAYLIGNIEVLDPEKYQEYARGASDTVKRYGGRYIVRGGRVERREGDAPMHRVVVIEFPSMEDALRWYESPEYRPLRDVRQSAARSQMSFVEGYSG